MTFRKAVLVTAIAALLFTAAAGCGNKKEAEPGNNPTPRPKLSAINANEDDGAIYSTTKDFVRALVADERDKVMSLLTSEHRNGWNEKSFLITGDAKTQYDEFAVDKLQHTEVKYVNNEETNFENTGMVFAVYDVVMKKNGQEEGRVKIQESLVFRQENGKWLISLDERGFLVPKN